MSATTTTTITLEIGELDKNSNEYPLRLLLHGENGLEEKAKRLIPKEELERGNLEIDAVKTFLEEKDASDEFQTIGEDFYARLHQGDVADQWDEIAANNERLRVLLEIKPAEIAALPWELVTDGLERLAVNPSVTFIRSYKPVKPVKKILADSLPLRILIVVGARHDDKDVSATSELRRIEAEIHQYRRQDPANNLVHRMIDIEILRQPNLTRLEETYLNFKPHIFHFIGHGGLNSNNKAFLVINHRNDEIDQYEPAVYWTTDQIYNDFIGWEWIPRFVFINACRSESKTPDFEQDKKQAWSIGDVFRRLRVPAVLTMQADINGEAAGICAGAIYKSLVELDPLDTALGHARRAIRNFVRTYDKREWAIPVLTVAIPPEEILPLITKTPQGIITKIKDCDIFKDNELFSDRRDMRRALIRGFYPLPPVTANKNLIIVKGRQQAGKSWLAKWCMEACALLNHDIRYVEVGGLETKTWLDLLIQIRDGDETQRNSLLIHQPLDEAAFYQFNWELEHRFRGQEPPVWDGTPVMPQKFKLADPNAKWTPNFIRDTFNSFRLALVQAAKINNPLIIVLDHFTKNAGITRDEMTKYLIPELIEPISQGKLKEDVSENQTRLVKFILVMTETDSKEDVKNEFNHLGVEGLVSSFHEVKMDYLKPNTFIEVASEYLRNLCRNGKANLTEDEMSRAVEGVAILIKAQNNDYAPKELQRYFG